MVCSFNWQICGVKLFTTKTKTIVFKKNFSVFLLNKKGPNYQASDSSLIHASMSDFKDLFSKF